MARTLLSAQLLCRGVRLTSTIIARRLSWASTSRKRLALAKFLPQGRDLAASLRVAAFYLEFSCNCQSFG